MKHPKRKELRARMRQHMGQEKQMRDEIQNAFAGYLKGVEIPQEMPPISDEVDRVIESMTDFIAISRAVVIRSKDTKQDINYIVEPEMSSRVYKQLYVVAASLVTINKGSWTPADDYILHNLAVSSIHSIRYSLIKRIMSFKTKVKTSTLAMELGYPTSTTRRYLEDLAAISMDDGSVRILHRSREGKATTDLWEVTPAMKAILEIMGENIEATKSDAGFEQVEEDVPVGSSTEEPITEDKQQEIDDLTGDLPPEELARLGL